MDFWVECVCAAFSVCLCGLYRQRFNACSARGKCNSPSSYVDLSSFFYLLVVSVSGLLGGCGDDHGGSPAGLHRPDR